MKQFFVVIPLLFLVACNTAVPDPLPPEDLQADKKAVPQQDIRVAMRDYEVYGDPDAPVTLIEYSDYQCPFCKKFTTEVLPQIDEAYIQSGVVKLIFRDFPLHIHPLAIESAVATHCAGEQGKYYPYHDLLFERSKEIASENFGPWADELGINREQFDACLDDPMQEQKVMNNITEAKQNGVVGTPSFMLNGRYIAGAQPFSFFERAIKRALGDEAMEPVADAAAVCTDDADCGEARAFPPYCSRTVANEVCVTSGTPTCTYPGTDESACVMMIKEQCTTCEGEQICSEGMCRQEAE